MYIHTYGIYICALYRLHPAARHGTYVHVSPPAHTVEPVLKTTSIQRPTALSDHFLTIQDIVSTMYTDVHMYFYMKTTCLQRPRFLGFLGGLYRQAPLYYKMPMSSFKCVPSRTIGYSCY